VGQFDTINVVAQPGADKAQVQRDIARVLPHGVQVVTGQTVRQRGDQRHRAGPGLLNTALLVFAFIALFVAIHHLEHLLHHRGPAHAGAGAARIVGASRRQVFRSVWARAPSWGVVSSLIGLGLGVLAAVGLEKLLSGFGSRCRPGPRVRGAHGDLCIVVGVGVTMVSAISPARRAVRIAPVAAVSAQQTEEEVPLRRRFTRGGIITVIGIALLAWG